TPKRIISCLRCASPVDSHPNASKKRPNGISAPPFVPLTVPSFSCQPYLYALPFNKSTPFTPAFSGDVLQARSLTYETKPESSCYSPDTTCVPSVSHK